MFILRFAVPFLGLLSRRAKSSPRTLVWMAGLALAGQWLDLHWIIMPAARVGNGGGAVGDVAGGGIVAPLLPWQEIGPFLLLTGAAVLVFGYLLTKMRPVAVGDPVLEASRRFHL